MKIKWLKNLGTGCPSQWEGKTEDGQDVYIRYRWSHLSVEVGDQQLLSHDTDDGGWNGIMDDDELVKILKDAGWSIDGWQETDLIEV